MVDAVYEAAGTDYSCLSIRRSSTWDTPRRSQSLAVPAFSMVGEGHLDLSRVYRHVGLCQLLVGDMVRVLVTFWC